MHVEYCFGSSPVAAEVLRFRPKSGNCMPRHTASESDTEPTAAVSTRKTSRRTYRSAIIARSPAACGFSGPITRPDVSPLTRFCTILSWDMSQRTCWKGRLSKSATTSGSERTRSFCPACLGSATVTKDVGPYEIVAGNPARAIRMRFDERQIAALESSRW